MAACIVPFTKRDTKTGQWLSLPCGKCHDCLSRRISGWSFRLLKHGQTSQSAHFVTLTYNTDHVPLTKNGLMSLDKTDLQKFFKRLRKLNKNKLSYYAVGEYGTNKQRPHYHAIIFNANPLTYERAWSLNNIKIGDIHLGDVSEASIGYTLKYICKPSQIPKHRNDDRKKEFSLMSKKLGASYLTPQMVQYHHNDMLNRMFIPISDGKKIAMPKYFKLKIYTDEQREKISEHIQHIQQIENEKNHLKHGENYEISQIHSFQHKKQKFEKSRLTQKL